MNDNYPPGSDTPNAPWNQAPRRIIIECECGWQWIGTEDYPPAECEECDHAFTENELDHEYQEEAP